jgi:alkanesulfonate monooxygenase SsuD/methylene tetrahydromethanopterin reductase-like flavin-dependent oxidoreductase (luciferase family)
VVAAEEAGFNNFWSVEHHFQRGFSHSSAPEVLYGALSQGTSRIRIGHAVVLLPFPTTTLCASRSRSRRLTS